MTIPKKGLLLQILGNIHLLICQLIIYLFMFSGKDSTTYTGEIERATGYEEARIWNSLNIGDSLCINHYQGRFWNVSKVYAVKEKGREPPE